MHEDTQLTHTPVHCKQAHFYFFSMLGSTPDADSLCVFSSVFSTSIIWKPVTPFLFLGSLWNTNYDYYFSTGDGLKAASWQELPAAFALQRDGGDTCSVVIGNGRVDGWRLLKNLQGLAPSLVH